MANSEKVECSRCPHSLLIYYVFISCTSWYVCMYMCCVCKCKLFTYFSADAILFHYFFVFFYLDFSIFPFVSLHNIQASTSSSSSFRMHAFTEEAKQRIRFYVFPVYKNGEEIAVNSGNCYKA